jgi:2-polyprenyl-3-methyl-5-hydroxy-6-metoxy-1,4-benzoquinol methylase
MNRLDDERLNAFMAQAVNDLGAAMHAVLVYIGDRLGLYKAMAAAGPATPAELAHRTGTDERYIREWLNANAASGYVSYDASQRKYSLPPEQTMALAVETSAVFLAGAFQIVAACFRDQPRIEQAFRTGRGVGWHEHDSDLFCGTERFFRPTYAANLIGSWIPALSGVESKLREGARVADIGCGHGSSTILMAQSYSKSIFTGYDYHAGSIEVATGRAKQAGIADRVKFEVAPAKSFPGANYDLVTFFDCLHDMGDPAGAAAHVRQALAPDGTWMIVEPFANDEVEDNLTPVGRVYYSASTMICTPASKAQEIGLALGAQAGEARLREIVMGGGGFRSFRRAAETPFNIVFEAKP